jgi:hypothetical protein
MPYVETAADCKVEFTMNMTCKERRQTDGNMFIVKLQCGWKNILLTKDI